MESCYLKKKKQSLLFFILKGVIDKVDRAEDNFFSFITEMLKVLLVKGFNLEKKKSDFFSTITSIFL